jgi:hypothetical protein
MDAHTDARTRLVYSTSVESWFAIAPLPGAVPGSAVIAASTAGKGLVDIATARRVIDTRLLSPPFINLVGIL